MTGCAGAQPKGTETKNVNSFRFIKQALEYEIERQIGPDGSGFLQPRRQAPWCAQAAKFAPGEKVDMIYIGVSAEQRRKLGINHPRDLGARVRIAKQGHRRKGVDDISERTRLND